MNKPRVNTRSTQPLLDLDLTVADALLPAVSVLENSVFRTSFDETDEDGLNVSGAALLNLFGQPPIAFHRVYADISGGVLQGLWLSHAISRAQLAERNDFDGDDFILRMSSDECEKATGIKKPQQISCRRDLEVAGLISVEGKQGKTTIFRIHLDAIHNAVSKDAANDLLRWHRMQSPPSSGG